MFHENLPLAVQNIVVQNCTGMAIHFWSCGVLSRKCIALGPVQYPKLHHGLPLTTHTFPHFVSQLPWNCCMALKYMKFENYSHDLLECDTDRWQHFGRTCSLHLAQECWCQSTKTQGVPCQKMAVAWLLLTNWKERRRKWFCHSTIGLLVWRKPYFDHWRLSGVEVNVWSHTSSPYTF